MLGHQVTWVFNAAIEHFVEQRNQIELELIRWGVTKSSHRICGLGMKKERTEEIERLRKRLIEYNALLEELVTLKNEHANNESKLSAKGIADFLQSRPHAAEPVVAATKKRAKAKR